MQSSSDNTFIPRPNIRNTSVSITIRMVARVQLLEKQRHWIRSKYCFEAYQVMEVNLHQNTVFFLKCDVRYPLMRSKSIVRCINESWFKKVLHLHRAFSKKVWIGFLKKYTYCNFDSYFCTESKSGLSITLLYSA